mgnify:FL=1|jgi:hypothetical protein|tara:strand:+ start:3176 stop:3328 length:153 start_codon:yes stop_codon:yes gene_type:complete
MDEQLFTIIGKLYVEALNSQKVVELLQNRIQEKDEQIQELKNKQQNSLNE